MQRLYNNIIIASWIEISNRKWCTLHGWRGPVMPNNSHSQKNNQLLLPSDLLEKVSFHSKLTVIYTFHNSPVCIELNNFINISNTMVGCKDPSGIIMTKVVNQIHPLSNMYIFLFSFFFAKLQMPLSTSTCKGQLFLAKVWRPNWIFSLFEN